MAPSVLAPELVRQELDPIIRVVPSLVPEGLTQLLGPPRIGKSEICLDLALEHTQRLQERIQCLLADDPEAARSFAEDRDRDLTP